MSDIATTTTTSAESPTTGANTQASPETPAVQTAAVSTQTTTPAPTTDSASTSAAMRQALLRSQVAAVLGTVQATWVVDAAISAAKPDLAADYSGLTGASQERIKQFKAENAFAFQAPQAPTQAPQTQAPAIMTAQNTNTETLPATPGSNTGAAGALSTDQLRQLGQIHVDPRTITAHADWSRIRSFYGVN